MSQLYHHQGALGSYLVSGRFCGHLQTSFLFSTATSRPHKKDNGIASLHMRMWAAIFTTLSSPDTVINIAVTAEESDVEEIRKVMTFGVWKLYYQLWRARVTIYCIPSDCAITCWMAYKGNHCTYTPISNNFMVTHLKLGRFPFASKTALAYHNKDATRVLKVYWGIWQPAVSSRTFQIL